MFQINACLQIKFLKRSFEIENIYSKSSDYFRILICNLIIEMFSIEC